MTDPLRDDKGSLTAHAVPLELMLLAEERELKVRPYKRQSQVK